MPSYDKTSVHKQPALVASTTEDDDEDNMVGGHERLVDEVRANRGANREALAYLLRYETMVRQQEAEDMATLAHIRPCVERLEALVGAQPQQPKGVDSSDAALLTREISFQSLKRALEVLEEECDPTSEFMTTDRQLMMVLRLLTQKTGANGDEADEDVFIAWAEFFQAYKVCIVGMLTLQHLPASSAIRRRARDRTLAMLSLFEAPSSELFRSEEIEALDSAPLTRETYRAVSTTYEEAPGKKGKRRSRTLRFLLAMVALAAFLGIIVVTRDPQESLGQSGNTKREPVSTTPSRSSSREAPTPSSPSVVFSPQTTHLQPSMQVAARSFTHTLSKTASLSSFPQTELKNTAPQQGRAPVTRSQMSRETLVGGVLGLVVAPFAIPAAQAQLVVASSLTAINVASAAVFAAGLFSLAAATVGGLLGLVRRLTASKKHHN